MADLNGMTPGQILADSSVAEFIKELGLGIAAAQTALDDNSVKQMQAFTTKRDDLGGRSLLDLGLSPAFYHYQHADISCAMQIRMEVGTSDEFGFGVSAGFGDETNSSRSGTDSASSSASGQKSTKTARLEMTSDSPATLNVVGGTTTVPAGATPGEKLADLQKKLATGIGEIDRLVFTPPATPPAMALSGTAPAAGKVVVQSPTIAFLRPDGNAALIRITENTATTFKVNSTVSVSTTAQSDLAAYAEHVRAEFAKTSAGFTTTLFEKGNRVEIASCEHETGVQEPLPASVGALEQWALLLKAMPNQKVEIAGFTDRQGPAAANIALGDARARTVHDILVGHGVPTSQLTVAKSTGEKSAEDAGLADASADPQWRTTKLYATPLDDDYWILATKGKQLSAPAPTAATGNAFIATYQPQTLNLTAASVNIDGTPFPFRDTEVKNGPKKGSGGAYAHNLTVDINATTTHRAWRVGNVVWVAKVADKFSIQLFSTAPGAVAVEAGSFTVTEQFYESSSNVQTQQSDRKRTVAVGVSVSARFSRQFSMEVTGNSSISARLVSVPAPPEFLDQIAAYQNSLNP